MGVARQELAEASNTIAQLRKNQEPYKLQLRDEWQKSGRWQDQNGPDRQGRHSPGGGWKVRKAALISAQEDPGKHATDQQPRFRFG
jgi:hypothetical protein